MDHDTHDQLVQGYGAMTGFCVAEQSLGIVSPAQARTDKWGLLQRLTDRLAVASHENDGTDELAQQVAESMDELQRSERFYAFPRPEVFSMLRRRLQRRDYDLLAKYTAMIARLLGSYGDKAALLSLEDLLMDNGAARHIDERHYFTVLLVDNLPATRLAELRAQLRASRKPSDNIVYELLVVDNVEDAALAVLYNHDIQACVISSELVQRTGEDIAELKIHHNDDDRPQACGCEREPSGVVLGRWIRENRPHIDLYLTTDQSVSVWKAAYEIFRRTFYRYDSPSEIDLSLIAGVRERYETPFFDALKRYAAAPVGNFHALPIARGNSVFNSKWLQDMREFYGRDIFLAETSTTLGGLDSLLAPKGTIKRAMEKAAKTWGADRSFFVTNGTSTANKIVVQALIQPGDVVLIDRNCHKSHHYGVVLSGAHTIYLDLYKLNDYGSYGAVPLSTIEAALLELRRDRGEDTFQAMRIVLLLTNCTFDGVNYNPELVMRRVLAIKPNICFLWDEAWFGFAVAVPQVRDRTAMPAARRLAEEYASASYRARYAAAADEERSHMADPDRVRLRVYSTQSTHKSLSALRQGSMIHVFDQDYERDTAARFNEAFQIHTSTSPNYQIIASLDLARRQVDLEGYGMLTNVYQMAQTFRLRVANDPRLNQYFRVLDQEDLIPEQYRPSGFEAYTRLDEPDQQASFNNAFDEDEFMLDRTRCTLYVPETALSGKQFQTEVLMGQHGIQVNKTSTNNVLFIFTIGVTWSSLKLLLDALARTAAEITRSRSRATDEEQRRIAARIEQLKKPLSQTDFSGFHPRFRPRERSPEGDMRAAYDMAYTEANRRRVALKDATEGMVSAAFVIPTPPGFPILVPGQMIEKAELKYLAEVGIAELVVFADEVLSSRAAGGDSVATIVQATLGHAQLGVSRDPQDPRSSCG